MSGSGDVRRGRPRDPNADQRIMEAAAALILEHGLDRTTVDGIAELAGVGKATVYRRWASKDDLAVDALAKLFEAEIPVPDTGSLRDDLERVFAAAISFANSPTGTAFIRAAVGEACRDPRIARLYSGSVQRRRQLAIPVLQRAVERGELSPDADLDLIIDWLPGLLIYRVVTREPLPTLHDVPGLVDYALRGILAT